MSKNEAIIRSGYAAAEGGVNDVKTFVSLFTADGVILDVASGTEYLGKESDTRKAAGDLLWALLNSSEFTPVSYTHLTLPTIYSV